VIRGLVRSIRVGLALSCAGLLAACGSQRAAVTSPAPAAVTVPLSTSLVTAQGTWAIAVMGGSAASHNDFWQLFVRPAGASRWSLVTPQGVADNGGLVATGATTSLTVGFRPSQSLAFSPLATSTDAGKNWTPGLLDAGLADSADALAVSPSGRTLALLQDGTITAAPTAGAAAAGQWTPLTTRNALAASAPGRSCGLVGVNAVSFGPSKNPMAAGSCARPGVADNGGLVAAGGSSSLTVGFRPSQSLAFSPLATSTDTGKNWTPGLLDAGLADTPGALAVGPSGRTLALLQNGTITAAQMKGDGEVGGAAGAGQWTQLTTRNALAASAPGRSCGLVGVNAVSFGPSKNPMVAGNCARPGVAGIFTDTGTTWQSAGLVLSGKGPGTSTVQVLGLAATAGGNVALLAAGNSVFAAWWNGTRWTVSAPVTASTVRALGFGAGGSAWLLPGGGRAEIIGGAGRSWQALPPVPSGTATLAPQSTATGGNSYDALAVSGSKLTGWRLAQGAWAKIQLMNVPMAYGSSS